MKNKNKKWLFGALATTTVVAPVAAMVSCNSNTSKVDTTSDDDAHIWDNGDGTYTTVKELKDKLQKSDDAQTASSNFISQIKYELTETLYNEEQQASIENQKAFLRWDIYTAEKAQVALAKEIASLKKGANITSSQITLDNSKANATTFYVGTIFGLTGTTYDSKTMFEAINALASGSITQDTTNNESDAAFGTRKTQYNSKLDAFKASYKSINTGDTSKRTLLKKIDDLKDPKNAGWDSSSLSTNYQKVLKPIEKIQELQQKTYNEAKAAYIDKYKTSGDGEAEWTKERSSKYNGATTDKEAVKYLVNQQIQTAAFGRFTYSLNDTYTMEQYLATYKDDKGDTVRMFPWFDKHTLYDDKLGLGDKKSVSTNSTKGKNPLIWTNDKSKFATNATIDASNIIDQDDAITPLLGNKVYFLNRNTLATDNMIVDLNSASEAAIFGPGGLSQGNPILLTHSLIAAKPGAASNLVWTISKDSVTRLLEYWGGTTTTDAKSGIDLFTNVYNSANTQDKKDTELYNQFVSDDTGSRPNKGELGVNTYQWYARKGGMNDGFALGSMIGYSNQQNETAVANNNSTFKPLNLGNSIGDVNSGETILSHLNTNIKAAVPTVIKDKVDVVTNGTKSVADINNIYSQWVQSLTDDNVNSLFGSIFQQEFQNRKAAYALDNGASGTGNAIHNSYLVVNPDAGVHIMNIASSASDWEEKFAEDMINVAKENSKDKAKITWSDIYKTIFTDNNIIYSLLKDTKYQDVIKDVITKDKDTYDQWVKAGYVKGTGADNAAKGQEIIDAINKSIEATRINDQAQNAIDAVTSRTNTFLTGQMDNKFMDSTIDVTSLYDNLLRSLVPDLMK